MTKVDLKKELDSYRARKGQFRIVEIPALRYVMIDGSGDPNGSPSFASAIEALYPLAYGLKFASKQLLGRDYVVMPLEGLWWADDHTAFTSARDKSAWSWTLMLLQPDWITHAMFDEALTKAAAKNPLGRFAEVRFATLEEGLCVQTLHVGAFDDEAPLLARMHEEFIPQNGLAMTGLHHEIYFSDPRKGDPAKRRTLLRQPVTRIS
ncbi:GyrI-like domain-containing protein [Microbacterium sp. NPDC055903]